MSQVSALAVRQAGSSQIALTAAHPSPTGLVSQQTRDEVLRDTYMPGASDAEVKAFLAVCQATGLEFITREIHAVPRWNRQLGKNVYTFQTGIDGYRKIAESTGQYGGQLPLEWCDDEGNWVDVWLSKKPPSAARARVVRKDHAEPSPGIATWSEFVQTDKEGNPTSMWRTKPSLMLAKCAIAQALRAAFPGRFAGVYIEEEMQQADNEQHAKPAPRETIQAQIVPTVDDAAKWLKPDAPTTKATTQAFVAAWMKATGCAMSASGILRRLSDAAGFAGVESKALTEKQWKAIGGFAHDAAKNGLTPEQATEEPIPAGTDNTVKDHGDDGEPLL